MGHRSALGLKIAAIVMVVAGAVVSAVYFFQPWRTCDYEDTSAGCAMLPQDAAVMMTAMAAVVVGVVLFLVSTALVRREPR
ncbi:hypothetical protein [Microbacterium sp. WCS2018Hpa-9]|uniref:hypothetical protein n=1 Tax=Microbacterium sp. WCS2018Hpa-9 TaxID=3073635 RepID=UPI00288BE62B|nr:hypothetical protein [Microbacterium sp. WCS2018Hpa-9]